MVFNTATVSLAVMPTVLSTLFSHYLNRKPLRQRPTAHLSYDQGLHLVRKFLIHASHHTVEELQAFTSQWVPHPQWIRVETIVVPEDQLAHAAAVLQEQLGSEGLRLVGGRLWWQWRQPHNLLKAEWIEMRRDFNTRKRTGEPCRRVMFYIHGGAYFMNSVDEERYQLQRHARKLKSRVLAVRYRLAPQFPFPAGLQDCLAAYLHLLTLQDASTIVMAGDSAGGGMILSMLVTMRDRGIPMPAGAILISPWVDLTHSFPSMDLECPFDYIPPQGFHQRPSMAWPPPTEDVLEEIYNLNAKAHRPAQTAAEKATPSLNPQTTNSIHGTRATTEAETNVANTIDEAARAMFASNRVTFTSSVGEEVHLKEQIHMYTTNNMLNHPLVSPALQPTLGGLPPLLVMTGGGEILRDEQIFMAHKCANPTKYSPPANALSDDDKATLERYPSTNVQLQVWDDLCHVAPTLSFTRPAKFMFRSIAQFGAWALARAQNTEIEILDDDDISVISSSSSDATVSDEPPEGSSGAANGTTTDSSMNGSANSPFESNSTMPNEKILASGIAGRMPKIGRAGDPLPPFKGHMIRQRVTRHGDILPLAPASDLPGCTMPIELVGFTKPGPVGRWTTTRKQWDNRYAKDAKNVLQQRLRDAAAGLQLLEPGEIPPPSALAGRRKIGVEMAQKAPKRSMGLSLWSSWGSKHDKTTVGREEEADDEAETVVVTADNGQRSSLPERQTRKQETAMSDAHQSRSRRRVVRDEQQTEAGSQEADAAGIVLDENTSAADMVALGRAGQGGDDSVMAHSILGPPTPACGHTNSLADSARGTHKSNSSGLPSPKNVPTGVTGKRPFLGGVALPFTLKKEAETASMVTLQSAEAAPGMPTGTNGPISPTSPVDGPEPVLAAQS